ncbi:hypothetical protein GCM10027039_01490 [Terrabacter koreensis]
MRGRFRHPARTLTTAAVGVTLAITVSGPVPTAQGASAGEIYRYPVGQATAVELVGHGFGHGRGMSQYGARGAAAAGLTWQQTLDFYYPATTRSPWGGGDLAVRLDQLGTARTYLEPSPGLQIAMGRPTTATTTLPTVAPTGKPATAYAIVRDGTTLRVEVSDGQVWSRWDVTGNGSVPATPFAVSRPDGGTITTQAIRTGTNGSMAAKRREYRGRLVTWPGTASGSVTTVNEVGMDLYLRGVVPSEMPASWAASALAAQSVAARTYAAHEAAASSSTKYDICDTTSCQVYLGKSDGGVSNEYAAADAAIAATAGVLLTYSGQPAFTQFTSSNGGYSVAGSAPYLMAKPDPYDGRIANSANTWSASVTIRQIETAYPAIGSFRTLRILSRDGRGDQGGRVLTMALDGTSGTASLTGAQFASRFGLRHYWFRPTNAATPSAAAWPRDWSGDGKADVMTLLDTGSANVVTLHRGTGTGGLAGPWVRFSTDFGRGTRVFTAGPWDADETGDLLAIRSDSSLWLYPGRGASGVGMPTSLGTGWSSYRDVFGAGDVDGDGRNDLVARHADGSLYLVSGDAQGGILGRTLIGTGWAGFTSVFSPGDFDGDRRVDLISRDFGGRLWLYPGRGDGTFGARRALGAGWSGYTSLVSTGDFTGDGAADLVARLGDGTLYVWVGSGAGGFVRRIALGGGWAGYSAIIP